MRRQADDGILLSQEAMRMTDEKGVQSIERALDIIESVAEEQDNDRDRACGSQRRTAYTSVEGNTREADKDVV